MSTTRGTTSTTRDAISIRATHGTLRDGDGTSALRALLDDWLPRARVDRARHFSFDQSSVTLVSFVDERSDAFLVTTSGDDFTSRVCDSLAQVETSLRRREPLMAQLVDEQAKAGRRCPLCVAGVGSPEWEEAHEPIVRHILPRLADALARHDIPALAARMPIGETFRYDGTAGAFRFAVEIERTACAETRAETRAEKGRRDDERDDDDPGERDDD